MVRAFFLFYTLLSLALIKKGRNCGLYYFPKLLTDGKEELCWNLGCCS